MLKPSSHDFVELCESQVTLLTQVIGASWSAIYLTDNQLAPGQPALRPLVSYPHHAPPIWEPLASTPLPETAPMATSQPDMSWCKTSPAQEQHRKSAVSEQITATPPPLESNANTKLAPQLMPWEEGTLWGRRQVMLPLLHNDIVFGLLVSRRTDRPWHDVELTQVRTIAHTLGIACFMDQQSQQMHQELHQFHQQNTTQQERLELILHQLRSPLTALRTLGKLLLKRFSPSDRNYSVAESLVRQSDRLQLLIQQLETVLAQPPAPTYALTGQQSLPLLPSPDAGEPSSSAPLSLLPSATLNPSEIDLTELLRPILVTTAEMAAQKDIQFTQLCYPDLLPIQGDAIALREVLSNLLDNALKYTPNGGSIAVEVGLESGNELGIKIQDTGVGIPPEDQAHIFERHYRGVQAQGDLPGTGLGLAIVQDLIIQMRGRIEVLSPNSDQSQGTTFTVWLPLA
ncbi:MAG: HAMP domain-containing histidine kinase [Spirulina sp. SIO3F2]|nr:HAMP domain-containing histidine kinase [Spirulina sp. SIO3F2]